MENYSALIVIGFIVVLLVIVKATRTVKDTRTGGGAKVAAAIKYSYGSKRMIMTNAESEFFVTLHRAVQERYYVFPQVHLSALLEHKVKGQNWHAAFRHINGKSVDFALCDKATLRPVYAIELDDSTHERYDRRERDTEVERMFAQANLPLVRFHSKYISEAEIIQALTDAKTTAAL